MPKGWPKQPSYSWTCPKCGVSLARAGNHVDWCGRQDELLWQKITKGDPAACWPYKGACDVHGYGRPAKFNKRYYAHRRIYEIVNGPIPEGMLVLHTCDNPPCCNPAHLKLGTESDNRRDMVLKKRHHTKLTVEQVREIRSSTELGKDLAARFGVTDSTVCAIRRGERWKYTQ